MGKTILFVFAHPDDESFACGGTMAKYAERGHDVYLVCATSGCKGKSGEYSLACRQEKARHRETELRTAAEVLGIKEVILYRYPDGALAEQCVRQLSEQIAGTIAGLKPHTVVTFPPDGVTGHPDHIAISRAVEEAVKRTEPLLPEPPDLWFVSIPHYYDYCEDRGPSDRCPITARVDIRAFRTRKGRALQAHRSQIYSVNRAYPGVMEGDYKVICPYEYYTLVRTGGRAIPVPGSACEQPVLELV
ncbi:hypothetical protein J31TS4_25750 [Paenibacillus sp. J31TS4]|uniref:PIG-L deacetylase family protein n=1 Tax=Paenibacillus sp. J31TS4 TaxID=2807195 RepID=UPI001B184238|nr:PIG-L deacetylase family protein [Paenibacillus sp. J31TS4]GIP39295.1 hypothetical protein J31TS4_25750 [Paenibacillus sp. J31TS4]